MPELPEVESVRYGLQQQVAGSCIRKVEVFWPNIIRTPNTPDFERKLEGQKIKEIKRRGKFLLFILSDWVLVSHLRMEGKYSVVSEKDPIQKHTHVIFHLTDGRELRYLDVRKFGRMSLLPKGEEVTESSLIKLGPEPVKDQLHFEPFFIKLKNHKKSIKALLLDQTLVAGIGNIYADEVLFRSKIHPERPSSSLSKAEAKELHRSILFIMKEAVEAGGTTIRTYENSFGKMGGYQRKLKVYGRKDLPCSVCGTPIKKIKVAQRGTHYCPFCQKKEIKVIGITGGIASGKTKVAEYIRTKGYKVISADEGARNVVEPGKPALKKIEAEFGNSIILPNGFLDRRTLGNLVFSDEEKRERLNRIIQPYIRNLIEHQIQELLKDEFFPIFVEIPLLYEESYDSLCDAIMVVFASYQVQLNRLMARNHLEEKEADQRIKAQWPLGKKVELADLVIDNDGDWDQTKKQLETLFSDWMPLK